MNESMCGLKGILQFKRSLSFSLCLSPYFQIIVAFLLVRCVILFAIKLLCSIFGSINQFWYIGRCTLDIDRALHSTNLYTPFVFFFLFQFYIVSIKMIEIIRSTINSFLRTKSPRRGNNNGLRVHIETWESTQKKCGSANAHWRAYST